MKLFRNIKQNNSMTTKQNHREIEFLELEWTSSKHQASSSGTKLKQQFKGKWFSQSCLTEKRTTLLITAHLCIGTHTYIVSIYAIACYIPPFGNHWLHMACLQLPWKALQGRDEVSHLFIFPTLAIIYVPNLLLIK